MSDVDRSVFCTQCVHHSRQHVRDEWETTTAEMIGVSYNVADAMTNIELQGQGPMDISTAWPARVMLLYGSHSETIDDWIKEKDPFGAEGADKGMTRKMVTDM